MKKTAADSRLNDPSLNLRLGFRLVQPEGTPGCKLCGNPTHPETEVMGFCGACRKSLEAGLRQIAHPRRSCSGVPFYTHAYDAEGERKFYRE